jgi:hypothetical protein
MTELKKYRVLGYLFEESLSRIWQHSQPGHGFILASAYRGEYREADNLARHERLKSILSQRKVGFFVVDGVGIENKGTPEEREVVELSVFVPYDPKLTPEEFMALGRELREKFDQDFVVVKLPDDNEVTEVWRNGEEKKKTVTLHPDQMAEYFSRLRSGAHRGRAYTYEEMQTEATWVLRGIQIPENNVEGMGFMWNVQLH